jgi:hypothetical protein
MDRRWIEGYIRTAPHQFETKVGFLSVWRRPARFSESRPSTPRRSSNGTPRTSNIRGRPAWGGSSNSSGTAATAPPSRRGGEGEQRVDATLFAPSRPGSGGDAHAVTTSRTPRHTSPTGGRGGARGRPSTHAGVRASSTRPSSSSSSTSVRSSSRPRTTGGGGGGGGAHRRAKTAFKRSGHVDEDLFGTATVMSATEQHKLLHSHSKPFWEVSGSSMTTKSRRPPVADSGRCDFTKMVDVPAGPAPDARRFAKTKTLQGGREQPRPARPCDNRPSAIGR